MFDDELNRQRAEISGEPVMTCALCGVAVVAPAMELVDAAVFAHEVQRDVDYVWICPDCWRTLGEDEFELEIEYV